MRDRQTVADLKLTHSAAATTTSVFDWTCQDLSNTPPSSSLPRAKSGHDDAQCPRHDSEIKPK